MIFVRCLGHIGTSVGAKELTLEASNIEVTELVDRVRGFSGTKDPGFTKFNTLVLIEDGEAFVAASKSKIVKDGERVALIPFSHGG